MEGDFTHLSLGFSHTPSVYSASNLDDDTTSIASSRLTRDRDNQTINDDDAFSEVNGDDTGSVVGLVTRRHGGGEGDIEEDGEALAEVDAKLPDWACACVSLDPLRNGGDKERTC
jgi:hypothetical protein